MAADKTRPPIPEGRPLEPDELRALLASVLLHPGFNPHIDSFQLGEFSAKATIDSLGQVDSKRLARLEQDNGGSEELRGSVNELCGAWVQALFLVPAGDSSWRLTDSGRAALGDAEDEGRVLDSTWYGHELESILGPNGDVVRDYAAEAHDAMSAHLYRSAAVMLGVAMEVMIEDLTEALRGRRKRLQLPTLSPTSGPVHRLRWAARGFRERSKLIRQALTDAGQSAQWVDDMPSFLGDGNAIRLLRNDSGHWTGVAVAREQVLRLFALFPPASRAISAIAEAIKAVPEDEE